MKAARRRRGGKAALDLIEEATHLLRTAPAATLAVYFVGAIPFVLGALYFWSDMSRSPFADQHLAEASLGVALLFLWLKFWQAMFARRVRAHLASEPMPRWTLRGCWRVFLSQAIAQPSGLFLIPLSAVLLVPLGWVYAFYQNVSALADDEPNPAATRLKNAWHLALLWPGQNHAVLLILFTFGLCIFLNLTALCLFLPHLIKMVFGIESVFTQSPFSMLNTTFFAAMVGLTYLCVDPILKVVYALRCFQGGSLQSGEDLKAELKEFATPARRLAAAGVLLLALLSASPAGAAGGAPAEAPAPKRATVSPQDLDRAINEVIHEDKYTWRMPREKTVESDDARGPIAKFFAHVRDLFRKWIKAAQEWLRDLIDKLLRRPARSGGSGDTWIVTQNLLLYLLVTAAIIALALLLFRVFQRRRARPAAVVSQAIQPAPDLAAEDLEADQLPEDGWTTLARELLERGELRLALRAFYLASLAHLAQRNLISIARFKSNRDYERELNRRGHSFPALLSVFGENVSVFERIWYGMHEINRELVNRFVANVEQIHTTG